LIVGRRIAAFVERKQPSSDLIVAGRLIHFRGERVERGGSGSCRPSGYLLGSLTYHLHSTKRLFSRLGKLVADPRPHPARLRELYLATFAREPSASELTSLIAHIERRNDVQAAYADILWAVLAPPTVR